VLVHLDRVRQAARALQVLQAIYRGAFHGD
jgi:hypothetical protein